MAQKLTRVIVTTDMEVDDMNSLVHLALYLNLLDVQAVVYTASQYHFLGDGVHTLGEVNPHWRTKGRRSYEWPIVPHEPDPLAGELREYRPFPEHWIESLWSNEYAQAWPQLQANADAAGEPPFPTPAQMTERTFVGNVAFEGDVTEETEGSRVIAQTILDDDPRTLWLLSWGGMNTIVRALMSIAERYRATPEWSAVQQRVYRKVRVMGVADGVGQDNSWLDHGRELFPELIFWRVPYMYGGYVDAKMAQPDTLSLFKAPWPEQNLTQGNGPLMARYMLYGDGKVYENEPERFQFGKHARLDWGLEGIPAMQFERGDFMAEGDSMTYIPLLPFGLCGIDDRGFDTLLGRMFLDGHPDADAPATLAAIGTPAGDNPNPYLRAYQEDFAARAQWCAHAPAVCSHPAYVAEVTADRSATAGERVTLAATVVDPDGKGFDAHWDVSVDPPICRRAGSFAVAGMHGEHRFYRARRRAARRPLRAHPYRADARRAPLQPLRPGCRDRGIASGRPHIRQGVSPATGRLSTSPATGQKWAICPSCGDSLSRLGIVKDRALAHHQK